MEHDPQDLHRPDSEPEEGEDIFDADDDDEENLMEDNQGDVASSDSELQVQDPSQEMADLSGTKKQQEEDDPMNEYYQKQSAILQWLAQNPAQKWVDKEFPAGNSQFYDDTANLPLWGILFKNLEWRRPEQIIKDPKFMIVEQQKGVKAIEIDAKHGLFGASQFINALTTVGTKSYLIQKLIIERQYFEKGFVSFQFFKNGKWVQVIVDTLLPYEKQQNNRTCIYSSCNNPQQFWIQLMEKAYAKLHKNYERSAHVNALDILVDMTGGLSEEVQLQNKGDKKDANGLWHLLYGYLQQKFLLSALNKVEERGLRDAEQGQQGILQNHHYAIIDMRDFPKDNLKLIRLRNPWGNEGVWTGPFCEQADDWQKYKAVKEDVKNAPKTKKSDGSWWMSFTDFLIQHDRVQVNKIFSQNWEVYSIQSQWTAKTNGGRCPILTHQKATETKQAFKHEYLHPQSDDRWFNNPQFRIKINKDTRIYISLMLEDENISGSPYVSCGFMLATARSRNERFWQRPPESDIIVEVNYHSNLPLQREITQSFVLKKGQKSPGIYVIVPNINSDTKEPFRKEQTRKFYLRIFTPDSIDVVQLPETIQLSVDGNWTQNLAGGSRKIQVKENSNGKKKGQMRDNPGWCKNPQYFVVVKQPTLAKVILRKAGTKKYKGWKIGLTVSRYEAPEERKVQKQSRREKKNAGHNLQRLIQQTSQFLKPPVLGDVERKLQIENHEKFKESGYSSEEVSALFFKWNPTQGPFILIPSSDGEERVFGYKLTIYSNSPVEMLRLNDVKNQVAIGRWEKDISAGGCHLNEKQKEASHRTWSMNPKYLLTFKEEEMGWEDPVQLKITLAIAQKHWKKLNPNTVSGMIGIYLLEKKEGKLQYSPDIVVSQTSFLPVKKITLQATLGGEKPLLKGGYLIMPSTYESKVQGAFILSVKCDRPFELTPAK